MIPAPLRPARPGWVRDALLLSIGVAAVSTGAVFARLADAPALSKATWRCAIATAVIAALGGRASLDALRAAPRDVTRLALLAGTLLAAHFATWIASLDHTSVATSLLLVNTIPIWVVLLAPFVNGDRAGRAALVGVALALAGGAWLAFGGPSEPRVEAATDDAPDAGLLGPALAVLGAWGAAGYMVIGRRIGARVPLFAYLTLCYGTATAWLFVAALLSGAPLFVFDAATYVWLVALGLVPQLIGHSACNAALRRLPALLVALPLLLEPVVGSLLAWAVLAEAPPLRAFPAGALVLSGVALAAGLGRRPRIKL